MKRSGTGALPAPARARAGGTGSRAPARSEGREGRPVAPRPVRPAGTLADPRSSIERTVAGLGYDLVDIERAGRGLLRVTIDRRPGQAYAEPGEMITVGDCEAVTRQLQYVLEVDGVDYSRLEVSSPGLDRPLKTEADYRRFAGERVALTLKLPFEGRKHWQGRLEAAGEGWQLVLDTEPKAAKGVQGAKASKAAKVAKAAKDAEAGQTALGFTLDEVREARLVPVIDFKGRAAAKPATDPATDGTAASRDAAGPTVAQD